MIMDVLKKIKERPNMYLGKPSLERLKAFIDGYLICETQLAIESHYILFSNFQEYIQTRFNIKSSQNWVTIIESFYSTKEEAFYAFFDLFEEFLIIKN